MKATLAVLFAVCCYVAARPSWGGVAVAFVLALVYVADRYADAQASASKLGEIRDATVSAATSAMAMRADAAVLHASVTKHLADIAAMVDRHGLSRR